MKPDPFRYDKWIEAALRGVVRQALRQVADHGFHGSHHFYLTFRTDAPGADIPDHLQAKYPAEMTIVLQHEYWDLVVVEDFFEVSLSFDDVRSRLHIPFEAVIAFSDPAVKFGLQLKVEEIPASAGGEPIRSVTPVAQRKAPPKPVAAREEEPAKDDAKRGEVIALDAFRKK